tara:strand:- start:18 stop:221 length:204 start_codon:yes stop_codon:yes gene_type:complete
MVEYSSHDWRKNTHDAIVADTNGNKMAVNDSRVIFKDPKTLKVEEVDLSRLIRVFVNNQGYWKRSVK